MMEKGVIEEAHLCFYPFLSAASIHVKDLGVTLEDLTDATAFERARLRGKERLREAIREGLGRMEIHRVPNDHLRPTSRRARLPDRQSG